MYIKKLIDEISKTLELTASEVHLEFPENPEFGDFTSNVALTGGGNPRQNAEKFVEKLKTNKDLMKFIEKIEVAGPGFINFWLNKDALIDNLIHISKQKEKFGTNDYLKSKKIMFEYGDANTHKLPHIGHLFSYNYGEAMTRILEASGAEVRKACYQGDIGLHVAKCLWAYQKNNPKPPKTLEEKVLLLQKMYQEGSREFEEKETAKNEIIELNKSIYAQDAKIKELWLETRGWSIEYYKGFEESLYINYDRYYYESEVYSKGQEIVEKNEGKVFKRSEGALIFEGSKYGLHDRVFVTKFGTPTYEAKDMYLQELKTNEWPMDQLIITTANEQNGYFEVVFKALETLNEKYVGKLKHIGFGMINLKSGKMSSRTGDIIGAIDVIKEVTEEVEKINPDKTIASQVAVGAIKYSFLKNNPFQNMTFDIKESISKEGNSGPYLQYTSARINSVLAKSNEERQNFTGKNVDFEKLTPEEILVLRTLVQYPQIVENAAKFYSPNLICNYAYNLAQKFNGLYNKERILGSDNESLRTAIAGGVNQTLKNSLKLLGIETPEKM